MCAQNYRKVMKTEHGRQIPQKLTANLDPSIKQMHIGVILRILS